MRWILHLSDYVPRCCDRCTHTGQMQSIISFLIEHSYFQLSILQQPIYCLYFSVVASSMQRSMPITVPRQRVILPMSIQQLQGFYISISSSCDKRRIPKEIASIYLRQRNQGSHHIFLLLEDGNHQRRISLLIPPIEVQLVLKPFNQIQDNVFILAIRNGQDQQILLLLEQRPRIHHDPQTLLIPLHQHLLRLLEGKGREGIDNCLWQFAELQYFPHLIQRQQIVMGSYNSKQQELQYHSQHENAIYGKGTIFSSNKLPNCYVIKTLRLLHDEHIFKLFEEIQNNQNIYLLSLYGYIMGKSCQCQVERVIKKCVLTYWQFLSFSLKDCIEYRRRISVPFHQNEIWHIIKAAVFAYASFERVNVYFEFQEEYLLINHQGRVRISWQHVQGRNEHLKYYKMEKEWRRLLELERGQSSGQTKGLINGPNDGNNYRNLLWSKIKNQQLYYSPEQLRSIANLQFTRKLNFSQSNIFTLGMLLLHLCTLQNPMQLFYNYFTIDYNNINLIMANQLSKMYSNPLLTLIGMMLNQDPHKRITAQGVREMYGPMMKGEYEINLMASRDKKSIRSRPFI